MAGEQFDAFMRSLAEHVDMTIQDGAIVESEYVDGVMHVRVIYNAPVPPQTVWVSHVTPEGHMVLEDGRVMVPAPVATANAGWFNVMPTNGTTTGNSTTSGTPPSDPVCSGCEQPVPDTVWRAVLRAGPDVPADRWYHLRCAPAETEVLEPEPETD